MSFSDIENHESEVAGFVAKAFEILNNEEFSKVIFWGPNGKDFVIKDVNKFEEIVLPRYFRHQKINSFIRQLNMYGFHKSRKDNAKSIFSHPNFLKGREDLLVTIKRKIKTNENMMETPSKKESQKPKKQVQTCTKQNQFMGNHEPSNILKSFLDSREHLDSRLHLNFSLNKLSVDDFDYMEKDGNKEDQELSIEHGIQEQKPNNFNDLGSFRKLLSPSLLFNSFCVPKGEQPEKNQSKNKEPGNNKPKGKSKK